MARGLLDALEVARHSEDDAIDLVDDVLKPSVIAKSPLIAYRLASDFQKSWKVEVGRWLLFAERSGFLPALKERIQRRVGGMRTEPTLGDGRPDPNEGVHRALRMELTPAMLAYYLSHSGWEFVAWEQRSKKGERKLDSDVRMRTPSGQIVDIQVKASDRPGRVVDRRILDGENDKHVVEAIRRACGQLVNAPGPVRLVAMCAHRAAPLSRNSFAVATSLLGITTQGEDGSVSLHSTDRGLFITEAPEVDGVILLDLIRTDTFPDFTENVEYGCTVFLNPWKDARRLGPEDFPHAAVCVLEGERFVWHGDPGLCFVLPTGTRYVDRNVTTARSRRSKRTPRAVAHVGSGRAASGKAS